MHACHIPRDIPTVGCKSLTSRFLPSHTFHSLSFLEHAHQSVSSERLEKHEKRVTEYSTVCIFLRYAHEKTFIIDRYDSSHRVVLSCKGAFREACDAESPLSQYRPVPSNKILFVCRWSTSLPWLRRFRNPIKITGIIGPDAENMWRVCLRYS